jgi:hypothetical protein
VGRLSLKLGHDGRVNVHFSEVTNDAYITSVPGDGNRESLRNIALLLRIDTIEKIIDLSFT